MRAYDFDNTIYDGESAVDFFLFCLWEHPTLITFLPRVMYTLLKYKLLLVTRDGLKRYAENVAFKALTRIDDLDDCVKRFWDKNERKVKDFYLNDKREDDIIISAGPSFLLDEILKRIGIKNRLCSEVDFETQTITRLCFRANKRELFEMEYPGEIIDEFYTDSANDRPLMAICRRVFMVKNNKITLYKVNKL